MLFSEVVEHWTENYFQFFFLSLTDICINYKLHAQIIIYSYNITFLYMFRAINIRLQEVTLYTCSIWYRHSENK
jgi:hypothetical protein